MRRFRRPDFTVPTLADTGVAGRKKRAQRSAFEDPHKKQVPLTFADHWNRPDVRGLLHAMQGRICAYCLTERPLDVDHFRPKGTYWWLAYEPDNYLLGCTACNRDRKGTSFPLRAGAVRVTYETRRKLGDEQRLLLNPAEDDVERLFSLGDDPTCPILPTAELDAADREQVQSVIDLFGLNLDATVRSKRSRAHEAAVRALEQGRWNELRRMAMRHLEHSFPARLLLTKIAPEHLPSEREELVDLTGVLWADLRFHIHEIRNLIVRGKKPRPLDLRQVDVYCWSLLVLQREEVVRERLAELLTLETDELAEIMVGEFQRVAKSSSVSGRIVGVIES